MNYPYMAYIGQREHGVWTHSMREGVSSITPGPFGRAELKYSQAHPSIPQLHGLLYS
jgi:hypothetical protein